MNRRTLLEWASGGLALLCAAVVAVPGVGYALDALRRRGGDGDSQGGGGSARAITQRVARLDDLVPGVPIEVSLVGNRRDAWTVYPQEVLGRVWLIRTDDARSEPADAEVKAFSALCPHLHCFIQLGPEGDRFLCPCHVALFHASGEKLGGAFTTEELGYACPTPRGMDALDCRVTQDEATGQWWVEVTYRKFKENIAESVPLV